MSRITELAACSSVIALLVALVWRHGPPVDPPALDRLHWPKYAEGASRLPRLGDLTPAGPLPSCGADVLLAEALVDPVEVPDREGEWVRLIHRGPEPISLDGWVLERGNRRVRLGRIVVDDAVILGGAPHHGLGAIRLPNRAGALSLYDPCGQLRARLAWGGSCPRVPPGWTVVAPDHEREGPARSVTGGALGGCGQT